MKPSGRPNFSDRSEALWIYPKLDQSWLQTIIQEFNIHPVTAQILVSRGFSQLSDIHHFLYATLPDLYDPFLFLDMEKACNRILAALKNKEHILIYGDNDVDGMTGTALLVDFLNVIGIKTFYYVPNRGALNKSILIDALEYAKKNTCRLIITVDCGITATQEIYEVTKHQVDVIITDHHTPTNKLPHCLATLNPKLVDSPYPNKDLTGVGVAFKLIHACTKIFLQKGVIGDNFINLKQYLDLVALGTIADMGALMGENRILVRYGLRQLMQTKRIGLKKLAEISEVNLSEITTQDIAAKIAPRLNSLGRVAEPRKGVEILLISDPDKGDQLAHELEEYNILRQNIERAISEEIDHFLQKETTLLNNKAIVLSSCNWHPGVIAITAAKLAKEYNRPILIISIEEGIGKGSLRTIKEFPLLATLKKYEDHLINYGGHDFAAGLTIAEESIPAFAKGFIEETNLAINDFDLISKLQIDAEIKFTDITFEFMESLALLEPFGNENPAPLLYADAKQIWGPKVIGDNHLKMYLEQDDRSLEGIGFGMAERKKSLKGRHLQLRVIFTPQINNFQNKTSLQLMLRDFKVLS